MYYYKKLFLTKLLRNKKSIVLDYNKIKSKRLNAIFMFLLCAFLISLKLVYFEFEFFIAL